MNNSKENSQEVVATMSDKMFFVVALLVTAAGTVLRFIWLGLKPFHHDEGVNGSFLNTLVKRGTYAYDAANYHGPDLYYIALFVTKIVGLDNIGTRTSVAIFGVFIIILAFWLRRHIGELGAITAAALLAISPGMLYISRYFIHEIIFVFFSLAIPVSIIFFIERRKVGVIAQGLFAIVLGVALLPTQVIIVQQIFGNEGVIAMTVRILGSAAVAYLIFILVKRASSWMDGTPIYLMLGVISVCMLFATKETGFITVGTMLLACVSVVVWEKIVGRRNESGESLSYARFKEALGTGRDKKLLIGFSAALFIFLWVQFFSSFFSNWIGVVDSLKAYAIWTKTGTDAHRNGFWAYLNWMWEIESPILLLSGLGVLFALIGRRNRFVVFASFWAMGISLAYTLIPYKTPWLMISFVLPMAIVGGNAIDEMARNRDKSVQVLGKMVAVVAICVAGWQSLILNFVRYDDQSMPYVYAHTWRSFDEMLAEINSLDQKIGGKKELSIDVVASEFWPLPWSLREFSRISFDGKPQPADGVDVVIARYNENQEEVLAYYQKNYVSFGTFPMRPGVELILLVRKDLAKGQGERLQFDLVGN